MFELPSPREGAPEQCREAGLIIAATTCIQLKGARATVRRLFSHHSGEPRSRVDKEESASSHGTEGMQSSPVRRAPPTKTWSQHSCFCLTSTSRAPSSSFSSFLPLLLFFPPLFFFPRVFKGHSRVSKSLQEIVWGGPRLAHEVKEVLQGDAAALRGVRADHVGSCRARGATEP